MILELEILENLKNKKIIKKVIKISAKTCIDYNSAMQESIFNSTK